MRSIGLSLSMGKEVDEEEEEGEEVLRESMWLDFTERPGATKRSFWAASCLLPAQSGGT